MSTHLSRLGGEIGEDWDQAWCCLNLLRCNQRNNLPRMTSTGMAHISGPLAIHLRIHLPREAVVDNAINLNLREGTRPKTSRDVSHHNDMALLSIELI